MRNATVAVWVVAVSLRIQDDRGDASQMLSGCRGQVRHRIAGDDQGRVALASAQHVRGRVISGAESRIATSEVDRERIAGLPRQDVVGTGHIAWPSQRHADEASMSVHVADQGKERMGTLMCIERVVVWPGPEKITPYLARFIRSINSCQVESETPVSASIERGIELDSLGQSAQGPECLEFLARLDREELVGHLRRLRFLERRPRRKTDPARPRGTNWPAGSRLYRLRWRGWLSTGLQPQKMIKSPRFLTSPSVHVTSPTSCNARAAGPSIDAVRRVDAGADPIGDRHGRALGFRGCLTKARE